MIEAIFHLIALICGAIVIFASAISFLIPFPRRRLKRLSFILIIPSAYIVAYFALRDEKNWMIIWLVYLVICILNFIFNSIKIREKK
jgi:hypothetical protein